MKHNLPPQDKSNANPSANDWEVKPSDLGPDGLPPMPSMEYLEGLVGKVPEDEDKSRNIVVENPSLGAQAKAKGSPFEGADVMAPTGGVVGYKDTRQPVIRKEREPERTPRDDLVEEFKGKTVAVLRGKGTEHERVVPGAQVYSAWEEVDPETGVNVVKYRLSFSEQILEGAEPHSFLKTVTDAELLEAQDRFWHPDSGEPKEEPAEKPKPEIEIDNERLSQYGLQIGSKVAVERTAIPGEKRRITHGAEIINGFLKPDGSYWVMAGWDELSKDGSNELVGLSKNMPIEDFVRLQKDYINGNLGDVEQSPAVLTIDPEEK